MDGLPNTTNLNIAECLRSIDEFGGSTIRICSGTETYVPWGSVQWALCVGISAFAVVVLMFFASMFFITVTGR